MISRSPWDADLEDRLVRYCAIDTPSDSASTSLPSTPCQWDLLRLLEKELRELGAQKVELTSQGFLMASLPSNRGQESAVVALLAHVDTTTQFKAVGVKPRVVKEYDGGALSFPQDPNLVLDPAEFPYLGTKKGLDLVTASGDTLLGADDKAGVAVLMGLARHLLTHPEVPHGEIRLCFTPDEEIGAGVKHLPLDKLGAEVAYTLDGGEAGELCYETFSADRAVVKIDGVSIHPGSAKGKLVNALHLGAAIIGALPQATRTPETTDGREGFIHLTKLDGTAAHCELWFILRDFELKGLKSHLEVIKTVAHGVALGEPRCKIEVVHTEQYRNMRYWLEKDMRPVDLAAGAYRKVGLEPRIEVLRGGTDGSWLTERGLPTPNLFTGMQNVHGPLEWVCIQDMSACLGVCLELVQLWGEQPPRAKAHAALSQG